MTHINVGGRRGVALKGDLQLERFGPRPVRRAALTEMRAARWGGLNRRLDRATMAPFWSLPALRISGRTLETDEGLVHVLVVAIGGFEWVTELRSTYDWQMAYRQARSFVVAYYGDLEVRP